MTRLDELGLAENTLVVFLVDNGPDRDRYNAGLRGRKGTVFEGGIRSPLLARWPARLPVGGEPVDRIAAHIDIAPTLLDAAGVEPPAGAALGTVAACSACWPATASAIAAATATAAATAKAPTTPGPTAPCTSSSTGETNRPRSVPSPRSASATSWSTRPRAAKATGTANSTSSSTTSRRIRPRAGT